MSADKRWARVDAVLQSALSRPGHEREAFVRSACAEDDSVRDEVLSLLAHASGADKFLEPASVRQPPPSLVGRTFGAYRLITLIVREQGRIIAKNRELVASVRAYLDKPKR